MNFLTPILVLLISFLFRVMKSFSDIFGVFWDCSTTGTPLGDAGFVSEMAFNCCLFTFSVGRLLSFWRFLLVTIFGYIQKDRPGARSVAGETSLEVMRFLVLGSLKMFTTLSLLVSVCKPSSLSSSSLDA